MVVQLGLFCCEPAEGGKHCNTVQEAASQHQDTQGAVGQPVANSNHLSLPGFVNNTTQHPHHASSLNIQEGAYIKSHPSRGILCF